MRNKSKDTPKRVTNRPIQDAAQLFFLWTLAMIAVDEFIPNIDHSGIALMAVIVYELINELLKWKNTDGR